MVLLKIKKNNFIQKIVIPFILLTMNTISSSNAESLKNQSYKKNIETSVYPHNRKLSETFFNGSLDGFVTLFYNNGQPEWRHVYYKGNLHGISTKWNFSGKRIIEGHYENGDSVGIWRWWDENGNIKNKKKFKNRLENKNKFSRQYKMKL